MECLELFDCLEGHRTVGTVWGEVECSLEIDDCYSFHSWSDCGGEVVGVCGGGESGEDGGLLGGFCGEVPVCGYVPT